MYQVPAFREDRSEVLCAAMHAHPLATLVTSGASGLTANLIPFVVTSGGDAIILRAHLSRGNSQLDDLRNGAETLVIFQGPQAYVTPSWYASKREHGRVVPTWNYVMVQARGVARVIDDPEWLRAQVAEMTDRQEAGQAEPWGVDDAPATFLAGQLRGIAGVEILVDRLEGKWKVSQNHPAANRDGVVAGLRLADPESPMAALVERRGG